MDKILILFLVIFIFFFRTIRYGYVGDDVDVAKRGRIKGIWKNLYHELIGRRYFSPGVEHCFNLLTHWAACSLIYIAFGRNNLTFCTAILFAVHPVNMQVSVHLSGRIYGYASILVLLMWIFKPIGWLFYLPSGWFAMSPLLMPLVFVGTKYWWMIFLIPIWGIITKKTLHPEYIKSKISDALPEQRKISFYKLVIPIKFYAYLLLHNLFPRRIGMYHEFLWNYGVTDQDNKECLKKDLWFWLGVVLIILSIALIKYSFFMLWYIAAIIIWLNYPIPVHQSVGERYYYIANMGLCMGLVVLLNHTPYFSILFTAFLVYYATISWLNMGMYKSDQLFLEYNIYDYNFPRMYFAYIRKAEVEATQGRVYKSLETCLDGLTIRDIDPLLNFHVAELLKSLKKPKLALSFFNKGYKTIIPGIDKGRDLLPVYKKLKEELEAEVAVADKK